MYINDEHINFDEFDEMVENGEIKGDFDLNSVELFNKLGDVRDLFWIYKINKKNFEVIKDELEDYYFDDDEELEALDEIKTVKDLKNYIKSLNGNGDYIVYKNHLISIIEQDYTY